MNSIGDVMRAQYAQTTIILIFSKLLFFMEIFKQIDRKSAILTSILLFSAAFINTLPRVALLFSQLASC